ncbi:MAG: hypothetical protein HY712_00585 [candidate division NC10 bacterium]|nr:hypothetical protein [candidate division NC10 bacterium]
MTLSRRLLGLLKVLDYPAGRIDYLIAHYQHMSRVDPPFSSEEERLQDEACRKLIERLTSDLVKERMEPTKEPLAPSLKEFLQDTGGLDVHPDAHFTVHGLARVSGAVQRWKELKPLWLRLLPEQKEVAAYIRQATECYIWGNAYRLSNSLPGGL